MKTTRFETVCGTCGGNGLEPFAACGDWWALMDRATALYMYGHQTPDCSACDGSGAHVPTLTIEPSFLAL